MKNRLIVFITAAIMLLCASTAVIGCGSDDDNAPKVDYSITVLNVDENPVKGATVSWQQSGKTKGSAKTNDEGTASTKLAAGTYKVVLSGLDEGLTYPDLSVTADMREGICITLSVAKVTYTATVLDKTGAATQGVTVTWANGTAVAGTATTDAEGKASCELDYGEYTVTVSNLPDGNIYTDTKTVTGKEPSAQIELRNGETVAYSVTVRSEGGLKFKDTTVFVYSGESPIYSGKTDENGVLAFSVPADNYTARVLSVQDGYTVLQTAQLTSAVRQGEVVLRSRVRTTEPPTPDGTTFYKIGDIIHDYEWTTAYDVNGRRVTYSIAEILATKDAVVINNWGTKCTWCVKEMPAMESVYQNYKDKIELLAISNYNGGDSESVIADYHEKGNYTFPMMRDNNSFALRFGITNFPTTIIIDRYGAIAHIEEGAIPEADIWERLIKRYVGDDYEQTFVPGEDSEPITTEVSKPDITVPADHYQKVAAAVNNFTADENTSIEWYGETESDLYWPFILKTEEGVSEEDEVLCSSNSKKPNSMSALYATVKMPAGKVLTFDYYSECETNTDVLSAVWDGKMIVKQISGISGGWKTCYLYAELTGGEHHLALAYSKDNSMDVGRDNVYIRNVRFENVSEMDEVMDMPRTATYGTPATDGSYPYYAQVELVDGYYHVKRDSLQNNEYAGSDNSPMLFVNMTGSTNWNGRQSILNLLTEQNEAGDYKINCRFSINGGEVRDYRPDLIKYCSVASASDISGFLPVDEELKDILAAFIAKADGKEVSENAWLELCFFFSHYGEDGEFIGNPIIGLTTKTAIVATAGKTITAECTRNMAPFPTVIYSFTPTTSAVYKIESLLPADSEQAAQVWLYDDETDADHSLAHSGDDRFIRDGQNEHNFVVYRYLTAGHKYYIEVAFLMQEAGDLNFKITNVGQSATELVPCSDGVFVAILGPDGETVIGNELSGAVSYYKDDEGYYRVGNETDKHDDDPYIYLDVKYPTSVSMSFTALVDQYVKIPYQDQYCDFKSFDFRKRIAYSYQLNGSADPTLLGYVVDYDLTEVNHGIAGRDYKDYTDIVKGYIEQSKTTDGLIKVNDAIKDFLTLFIETRINALNVYDNGTIEYEQAYDNEWLRLCWYYKTYNEQNP